MGCRGFSTLQVLVLQLLTLSDVALLSNSVCLMVRSHPCASGVPVFVNPLDAGKSETMHG